MSEKEETLEDGLAAVEPTDVRFNTIAGEIEIVVDTEDHGQFVFVDSHPDPTWERLTEEELL